nr:T9SS type A sorting domain-containing protein [Bacteroidia bacterium]
YSIQVRALVGKTNLLPGVWGSFGPACNVTLSGFPQTQLNLATCNSLLTNLTDQVFTIPVSGAKDYEYRVSNVGQAFTNTAARNSSLTDFRLNWVPSISGNGIRYSTTYDVEVRAKVGGVFGTFGNVCTVTTPASPLTALQPAFCTNYPLPVFSSVVNCIAVPGATNYRYHITGPAGYDKTFTRNAPTTDWRFSWTLLCCGQQNMLPSTTYSVEVASNTGGVWSAYGSSCTIVTPASIPRYSYEDSGVTTEETILSLSLFPNPAKGNELNIVVDGVSPNSSCILKINDLLGKTIYVASIENKESSVIKLQPEITLPSGVYLVEAEINGSTLHKKLIVE